MDRSRWGSFNILGAKSEDDVRAVIEAAAKSSPAAGTVERKVVDYYQAYNDVAGIDARGLAPSKEDLARIASISTHEDIVRLTASKDFRANLPIGTGVTLDAKRPDVYVMGVGQAGLGMPDRDYYLKQDDKFKSIRAKYKSYIETMLTLAQVEGGAKKADEILQLETRIAELHWPREKSRNRDLTYNPKTRAELLAFAPEFPWEAGLGSFGAPTQDFFIVAQADAVQSLAICLAADESVRSGHPVKL